MTTCHSKVAECNKDTNWMKVWGNNKTDTEETMSLEVYQIDTICGGKPIYLSENFNVQLKGTKRVAILTTQPLGDDAKHKFFCKYLAGSNKDRLPLHKLREYDFVGGYLAHDKCLVFTCGKTSELGRLSRSLNKLGEWKGLNDGDVLPTTLANIK